MKCLIFFLFMIVSCNAIKFRFLYRSLVNANSNTFECSAGDTGIKCYNCKVLAYCENGVDDEQINCPSHTPFCDPYNKECVSMDTCAMAAPQNSELLCMRQGFFPHPIEANKFMYCKVKNTAEKAIEYACPEGTNYDMFKKICTSAANVSTTNFTSNGLCKNEIFKTVVHPYDNSLYARCSVAPKPITVNMCENKNYIMNLKTRECEFSCPNEGFFPNLQDGTKYFTCIKDKNSYKIFENICPLPTTFGPDQEFCI